MKKTQLFAMLVAAVLATGCAGLNNSSSKSNASTTTASAAAQDSAITERVNAALQADPDLKAFKITANTEQGVVRLKGEIKSLALRRKAEELVKGVSGVKSVNNQLVITG